MPKKRSNVGEGASKRLASTGFSSSWRQNASGGGGPTASTWMKDGSVGMSDYSTIMPEALTVDAMRSISQVLDKSMEDSLYTSRFFGREASADEGWPVQSQTDILEEAMQFVAARRPWRDADLDEHLLDRRAAERSGADRQSCFVILPDNRVRAMDTQITKRVRAQIFGVEEGPEKDKQSSAGCRSWRAKARVAEELIKDDELLEYTLAKLKREVEEERTREEEAEEAGHKSRKPKRIRNPWYLAADKWFSGRAAADSDEEDEGGRFPYDRQILGRKGPPSRPPQAAEQEAKANADDDEERPLTDAEKNSLYIVLEYKQFLRVQGSRLPHYLQH